MGGESIIVVDDDLGDLLLNFFVGLCSSISLMFDKNAWRVNSSQPSLAAPSVQSFLQSYEADYQRVLVRRWRRVLTSSFSIAAPITICLIMSFVTSLLDNARVWHRGRRSQRLLRLLNSVLLESEPELRVDELRICRVGGHHGGISFVGVKVMLRGGEVRAELGLLERAVEICEG